MRRLAACRRAWLLLISIIALCLAAAWATSLAVDLPSRDDFDVVRWELRHLPNKWLYLTGRLFRGRLSRAEEDERLGRFLELSLRIDQLGGTATQAGSSPELARLEREREGLKNDVEAIIEGRITWELEDAGLESSLPLFPAARWVFPPVDAEFEAPPSQLIISPRDRIELIGDRPLRPGLSLQKIGEIEQSQERDGSRSALAVPLAGVSTYPSLVEPEGDYQSLVETAAHEWVHQYLFFTPLGSRFYTNLELRTLNETVATIAGQEIGALVVQRFPLPPGVASEIAALQQLPPAMDVGQALRALRLDVDRLLAQGGVAAAESLMEQKRQELARQGVGFRRINQAYFAFANVYATDPASTDPVGDKLTMLRQRSTTVGAFLRAASRLTSEGDLDRLLAGATSPSDTAR